MSPDNCVMHQTRVVARTLAAVLAGFLVLGTAACSGNGDSTTSEVSSMSNDELLELLTSEGTTQEEAVRIIEDLGFQWRIASIDGVLQPTTKDYREDRVTMEIDDGVVVRARWE